MPQKDHTCHLSNMEMIDMTCLPNSISLNGATHWGCSESTSFLMALRDLDTHGAAWSCAVVGSARLTVR